MALPLVSDVTAQVRSLLTDIGNAGAGEAYPDSVLIPFVQRAYRYAARYLRSQGVGLLRRQSASITMTAGQFNLTRSPGAAPNFPTDLLRPLAMREKLTGSGVAMQMLQPSKNDQFVPDMTGTVVTAFKIWDFRDDQIWVPPSTQSNDVQILYEADLPNVTAAGDTIKIPDSLDPLASLCAAFAAYSRDEHTNGDALVQFATKDLDLIAKSEKAAASAKGAAWGGN